MSFFLRAPCLQSFKKSTDIVGRAVKETTGIVGLEVIPNGREVLKKFVLKVLDDVKAHIPEETGYRKIVEATYKHRLDIIESTEDPATIEAMIRCGQIEELVNQAKDEIKLIPMMAEWKPWEFDHTIQIITGTPPGDKA